jgi:hypothetical protein
VDKQLQIESFDHNGILGQLTAVSTKEVDQFFRLAHQRLGQQLEEAKKSDREIKIDAFELSGTNSGDHWLVCQDRSIRRLDTFPEAETQLCNPSDTSLQFRPCDDLEAARPLLLRMAYNGLWSPSGTNWQPIRSVELTASEASAICDKPTDSCGLVVLSRRRYDSILGDVAKLCGIEQASHAEHIDLGIWLFTAVETAKSHGWEAIPHSLTENATTKLIEFIKARASFLHGKSQKAALNLIDSLENNDHYPAYFLAAHQAKELQLDRQYPGGIKPSYFDRLVEARSTQRVASPTQTLEKKSLSDLWQNAQSQLDQALQSSINCSIYSWDDELPTLIGKAMHAGIEGPEGLIKQAGLAQLQDYLSTFDDLTDDLAKWSKLDGSMAESEGTSLPLNARYIPQHISSKLQEGGQYHLENNCLLDHRDKPLTPVRLMKLVRMMAKSFGRFFLSFQNTHPLLGVILAATDNQEQAEQVYQEIGRAVARMTFLARARGIQSIIKSGPVEIARQAIAQILAQQLENRQGLPILTFQVGLALGPDEIVASGERHEHTGLAERLLDKRSSRASLSEHYIPA